MALPRYWLPRPDMPGSPETESLPERIYAQHVATGTGDWIEETLPVPKWAFLCWLVDRKGLLLHGSGNPEITEFVPRTPNDRSPDDFSKQTAVFSASDGIWPIFYAVLDRSRYRLRLLNGALRFERPSGGLTGMHYVFSVTAEVLAQRPWRGGVVYLLPAEGFRQQPPYELAGRVVHEPHWASMEAVRPLAKLRVAPRDFPFLERVRGHDDATVAARAASDPYGFPWLED